ncbi:hypothetical protein XaC1_233 [Xanthomonas phage XaC1]|nr:hypothetical protein XaC1_233 [Xanthomonas phage XaC1]
MSKYEMEFEELINRIVSKRIAQELSKLEVKVNGYESTNDGSIRIHASVCFNGILYTTSSGIIVKNNG